MILKHTEHILHQAKLKNNCPECYGTEGLELTFAQVESENKFFRKAEKKINESLYCSICKTAIYPVNWTDDIEQVHQYHKKQAIPKRPGLQPKPVAIIAAVILVGIIIALLILIGN